MRGATVKLGGLICLTALGVLCLIPACVTADETLETIVDLTEQQRAKIFTVRATIEWDTQQMMADGEWLVRSATREVIISGGSRWTLRAGGNMAEDGDAQGNTVPSGGQTAPAIDNYGFGTGDQTLGEVSRSAPEGTRWQVEEGTSQDGSKVFIVKRFAGVGGESGNPSMVFIVDPKKGFLVTQATLYTDAGRRMKTRRDIEIKQILNGIWFPMTVKEEEFDKPDTAGGPPKVSRRKTINVKSVSVNGDLPSTDKEMEALGFTRDDAVGVSDQLLDGTLDPTLPQDNTLIPSLGLDAPPPVDILDEELK